MFESSQNPKHTFSIERYFNEWTLLQHRSVPTEPLTLLTHQYLLIESHHKPSIALWVHPFRLIAVFSSQPSNHHLRGEPTESIDGNSHRNKTILFWSNCIESLHRKYMVFPLKDHFFNRKWTFRLKYSQTDRKPLKFIKNGCTHWAFRPILIGKPAHRKGNIKHV